MLSGRELEATLYSLASPFRYMSFSESEPVAEKRYFVLGRDGSPNGPIIFSGWAGPSPPPKMDKTSAQN